MHLETIPRWYELTIRVCGICACHGDWKIFNLCILPLIDISAIHNVRSIRFYLAYQRDENNVHIHTDDLYNWSRTSSCTGTLTWNIVHFGPKRITCASEMIDIRNGAQFPVPTLTNKKKRWLCTSNWKIWFWNDGYIDVAPFDLQGKCSVAS